MLHLLCEPAAFKVLTVCSLAPGRRFRRNELKERARLHNVPLDLALRRLRAAGVLLREGGWYRLAMEQERVKLLVGLARAEYAELREPPLAVYFLLTDLALELAKLRVEGVLFGSFAKRTATEGSDVDVAVLGPRGFRVPAGLAQRLEARYGRRLELHLFEKERFLKNKRDPLVREILRDGARFA